MKFFNIKAFSKILLLCLAIPFNAFAQNIDSLLNEVEKAETDTAKVKLLFNIVTDMRNAGDERFLATAKRTMRTAERTEDPKHIARSNYDMGLYYELQGRYDSAFYFYYQGIELSKNSNASMEVGYGYYFIGSAYRYKGDSYIALEKFDSALMVFTGIDAKRQMATCVFSQAVVLDNLGEFQPSIDKFYEALKIHESIEDDYGIANCYNSIGILTERTGDLEEAERLFKKGMEIFQRIGVRSQAANCMDNLGNIYTKMGRLNEAIVYHDLALNERREVGDERGIARSLMNVAEDHTAMKEFARAQELELEALQVIRAIGDKLTEARIHHRLSQTYRRLGQGSLAVNEGLLAVAIADSIDARNELMEARLALSRAYEFQDSYEPALAMYRGYAQLKDSIIGQENRDKVSELEAKYQNVKKEEHIKLQAKENEVLEASLSSRNFQMALVAALLLIAIGVVVGLRNRTRTLKVLAAKERELDQKRISELEQEQKILLMDAMITGQEEERKRVAKDLHDGLGVLLSTVQMHFSAVQEEMHKLTELDVYGKANKLLDEACAEVRKIAHNMMPGSLTKFGLPEAIEELQKNLMSSGKIEIGLQTYGLKKRLPEKVEIMLYRVVQEALNNSLKYAEASKITIDLSKEGDHVHLVIEDNGKGFNVQEEMQRGGHGLNNMHSRIKYLDGTSELRSAPGEGAVWDIKVPLV